MYTERINITSAVKVEKGVYKVIKDVTCETGVFYEGSKVYLHQDLDTLYVEDYEHSDKLTVYSATSTKVEYLTNWLDIHFKRDDETSNLYAVSIDRITEHAEALQQRILAMRFVLSLLIPLLPLLITIIIVAINGTLEKKWGLFLALVVAIGVVIGLYIMLSSKKALDKVDDRLKSEIKDVKQGLLR